MFRIASIAAAIAVCLLPAGASAASGGVPYVGKTSSGHPVTFQVAHGRMYNLRAGIGVSCVPIKGGITPTGGTDTFAFNGWVPIQSHVRFKFKDRTALWFNPVTKTHDIWMRRSGKKIKGKFRLQFSFLSPSFTPGIFTIYSCLGVTNFTARPK